MAREKAKGKDPRWFTTMPTRAIADRQLTALDLRCLMVISLFDGMSQHKGGGGCYARSSVLAERAETDISNFSKAVSRLQKLGYVVREPQQSDRRRFTLRVVFDDGDSWRADQLSGDTTDAGMVGELTNHPGEIVGEHTNLSSEIVGEAHLRNGGNLPKTNPHYIPLNGELDFDESKELDSAEAAHRAGSATRRDGARCADELSATPDLDCADVGLGRREPVSLAALLPKSWPRLATQARLAHFERLFSEIGRDPEAIEETERAAFEDWLFGLADEFHGEPLGRRAQRLLSDIEVPA